MKATKTKTGLYTVLAYSPDGRKRFTGPDKRKVMMEAAAWEAAHKKRRGVLILDDAVKNFLAEQDGILSPATLRGYTNIAAALRNLCPDFMQMACAEIEEEDIRVLISFMQADELSAKTIKNRLAFISRVLSRNNYEMPMYSAPRIELPELHVPDSVTVRRTLKAAKQDNPELWLCIMLAATGPLRRGEIAALGRSDIVGVDPMANIDVEANVIHVAHDMVLGPDKVWHISLPKTKRSDRYILMPHEVIQAIADRGYVTNWNPQQIFSKFSWLLHKNGIDHYRFHDLRHYCISELLAQGIEEIYIMERSGHETLGTMARYKHILNNHRKTVNDKILENFAKLSG